MWGRGEKGGENGERGWVASCPDASGWVACMVLLILLPTFAELPMHNVGAAACMHFLVFVVFSHVLVPRGALVSNFFNMLD